FLLPVLLRGDAAQFGAEVFAGLDGFQTEAAKCVDRLNEGIEGQPGYGQHEEKEEGVFDKVHAAAAERRFVSGQDTYQLRREADHDGQVESEHNLENNENGEDRPAGAGKRREPAGVADTAPRVGVGAIRQDRGVTVKGYG